MGWSLPSSREALDRRDPGAIAAHGERRAGLDGAAVDMDDASAALRGVAADMGAGQTQVLAQELDQQGARIDLCRDRLAVHRHGDPNHHFPRVSHVFTPLSLLRGCDLGGLRPAPTASFVDLRDAPADGGAAM